MKGTKLYSPGQHDKVIGEQRRQLEANISKLVSNNTHVLLSSTLLNSINLVLVPVDNGEGKLGFINKKGELVCDFKYDSHIGEFTSKEVVVAVRKGKKWSCINSDGIELFPFEYTTIRPSKDSSLVTMQNYDGWQVIDTSSNKVIVPLKTFEYIEGFRFGFARVKNNGLWGVISSSGRLVLDTKYNDLLDFYYNWDWAETKVKDTPDSEWKLINLNEIQ